MSPRAACRLESLGFTQVYDYVPGKVDWLANNLPVEGTDAEAPTAGSLARDDVVRCELADLAGSVRDRLGASPYGFALVTTAGGVVLGRVPASALAGNVERPVEEVMDPGPSTVRPHVSAAGLAKRLAERDLRWAIVTAPDGRLLGVVRRQDLESLE